MRSVTTHRADVATLRRVMQQRRLAYVGAAAATLVAAVLVPTPSALASADIFTQTSPITVSHEAGGQVWRFRDSGLRHRRRRRPPC